MSGCGLRPISTISDPITPKTTKVGDERIHFENWSHPHWPAYRSMRGSSCARLVALTELITVALCRIRSPPLIAYNNPVFVSSLP